MSRRLQRPPEQPRARRPLPSLGLLYPGHWGLLAVILVGELAVVLLFSLADPHPRSLDLESALLTLFVGVGAALTGLWTGIALALVAAIGSLLFLADFQDAVGLANALAAVALWGAVAIVVGAVTDRTRQATLGREVLLREALAHSRRSREQLGRVVAFAPSFPQADSPQEVLEAVCQAALDTFGADGARFYAVQSRNLELLALAPRSAAVRPGYRLMPEDLPEIQEIFATRRPMFVRDLRTAQLSAAALSLQRELGIVSVVRIPIVSSAELLGLLAVGWRHRIEKPSEELLAFMQRFADQAAIAWQNALRREAQKRADALYDTLQRVVELAPSFHIIAPREEVARTVCEAALTVFHCDSASLFAVEGDRLTLLDRRPPLEEHRPGTAFPLVERMSPARDALSRFPEFIPDVQEEGNWIGHWAEAAIRLGGGRSALLAPLRFTERGPQNLLTLSWDQVQDEPDRDLLAIVERFVDQVALALTNAAAEQLHARLEASLLPSAKIDHHRYAVITRYRTGEQRLRLGGDFLGALQTEDGGLAFVIGDVTGHGPDAAALGATLRSTWKALALRGHDLQDVVETMEDVLLAEKRQENSFSTVLVGYLDHTGRVLRLANAGHPPPLLIAESVSSLSARPAPPLGFGHPASRAIHEFSLPEAWILFTYTDGLTDARTAPGSPGRFGEERLIARLRQWVDLTRSPIGPAPHLLPEALEAAVDGLVEEVRVATGGRFADDVAIQVIATKTEMSPTAKDPAAKDHPQVTREAQS